MTRRRPGPGFFTEQGRVIKALIVREIYTRFGRENIGFAWIVVEPILFTLAVIVMWSMFAKELDVPVVEFLITGYMPLMIFRHVATRLLRCMHANADLLYHRQVSILAMYVARIVVEALGAIAAFVLTAGYFVLWGVASPPVDITMIIAGFALYTYFSASIGILVGALSERSEIVEKLWSPISYISVPLSGVFYMVYWLPAQFRDIIKHFPMVSGVEMIRGGYFGPGIPVYYSVGSSLLITTVILLIGLIVLRNARRYVEMS